VSRRAVVHRRRLAATRRVAARAARDGRLLPLALPDRRNATYAIAASCAARNGTDVSSIDVVPNDVGPARSSTNASRIIARSFFGTSAARFRASRSRESNFILSKLGPRELLPASLSCLETRAFLFLFFSFLFFSSFFFSFFSLFFPQPSTNPPYSDMASLGRVRKVAALVRSFARSLDDSASIQEDGRARLALALDRDFGRDCRS